MDEKEWDVLARIQERFQKLSKNHRRLADYILAHSDQAVFLTAAGLGGQLGISESTVVRFARAVGYDGYPQFQEALREHYTQGLLAAGGKDGDGPVPEELAWVVNSDTEKLKSMAGSIDAASFDAAVKDILEAETVYVMGLRGSQPVASFLFYYLNMIRPHVVMVRTTESGEVLEQLLRIGPKDCFVGISFPPYSMHTLKAMEFANDRNARVIAVTDDAHSPMNLYSSCNLFARSDLTTVMGSLVAPMSLVNALLVAMYRRRPEEVRRYWEDLQDVWENYRADGKDEINMIDGEALDG